jgi:parvulin-like peptidyl-prolyl isomerase
MRKINWLLGAAAGSMAGIICAAPTTGPATRPGGVSTGTYMILGTVLAEANGQPIYADKVLTKLEPFLATKARQLAPTQFRAAAEVMIRDAVRVEIYEELEFAAAQRSATDEEISVASAITTQWRQKEIIKAGGSVAVARQQYREGEEQIDFDEKVREQFRRHMVILYYQRRIFPLVSVSADDMRRYYEQNEDEKFAEKTAARFRAIKISVDATGGREKALTLVSAILDKLKAGEDFAKLAGSQTDDRARMKNNGWWDMVDVKTEDGKLAREPRWITKGSLNPDKFGDLEKQVFAMNPGQYSAAPIDTGDAFYLVKLEEKKVGRTRQFEDAEVQDYIRRELETEQRQTLRNKERSKLLKGAVARVDDETMKTAVDMAMQRYLGWAGQK